MKNRCWQAGLVVRWFWAASRVPAADTTPPSFPTGLSALAANSTSTSIYLIWNPSTDDVGGTAYEVFRDGVSVGTASGMSCNMSAGFYPGQYCNLSVRARDAAGNWSVTSSPLLARTWSVAYVGS